MAELHIAARTLKDLLDKVAGAVAPTGAHPALQCFHIEVTSKKIKVTASDQANTLIATEAGEFAENLDFIVNAARLHSIVRQGNGLIQLTLSSSTLTVVSGSTSWDIKLPAVTYPKTLKPKYPECEINAHVLRAAIKATRKSMAESPLRPSLRMLSIRKACMTACDGARLSQYYLGDDFPKDFTTAIPLSSVSMLSDILKDSSIESVGMSNMDNHHVFVTEGTVLMAKKLSSPFPNVEQLMLRPALENKQELIVDRDELVRAIDRVRINADSETDAMGLSLSAKSVTVAAKDKDGNSSTEVIPSNWMGKDRILVVNHKYLTAMVRAFDSEECHFFLGEDTKSRKSVVLLKDEEKEYYSVIPQFAGTVRIF